MNCSKFESVLSEYLDATLGASETKLFREHALQCPGCHRLMDEVRNLVKECGSGVDVESPQDLEAALFRIPVEHAVLNCDGFEEIITEFLDGFVPAGLYHRFEEHAAVCGSCSDLLTEVVYAVAACHSVHTYEEYEVSGSLTDRLVTIFPERRTAYSTLADRVCAVTAFLLPRRTQGAPWSFATASILAFASIALLMVDFSDDLSVKGLYRQARVTAGEIYSEGSDIYAQKDEVVGRLIEVRSDLGEIWQTLGGETTPPDQNGAPQQESQSSADTSS